MNCVAFIVWYFSYVDLFTQWVASLVVENIFFILYLLILLFYIY